MLRQLIYPLLPYRSLFLPFFVAAAIAVPCWLLFPPWPLGVQLLAPYAYERTENEAAIDKGNLDAMDELLAEDYFDHNPPPFPGLGSGREGLKQAFKFDNPNVDATCGRGESFSLREKAD